MKYSIQKDGAQPIVINTEHVTFKVTRNSTTKYVDGGVSTYILLELSEENYNTTDDTALKLLQQYCSSMNKGDNISIQYWSSIGGFHELFSGTFWMAEYTIQQLQTGEVSHAFKFWGI